MARFRGNRPRPAPAQAVKEATKDTNKPGLSRSALALAALLTLSLVLKAVVLAQLHRHPLLQPVGGLDTAVYVDLARRVASGDWALGPEPYFVAPLYGYFLGAIFGATGGSLLAAKLVQILLGTAAVGLVHLTAGRWCGPRAAWVASIALALTGVVTFNEVVLLQSAIDSFLTALGLFLLTRALQTPNARRFLVCGLAIGLHALNRPNLLIWAAALPLLLALRRPRARAVVHAAAVVVGVLLAVAPATLRNRAVSGEWVLISSHGGLNFYIGNNAAADGTYRSVAGITPNIVGQAGDARRVAEAARGRTLSVGAVSAHFTGLAADWIRAHPTHALRLFLRKLAYLLNDTDLALNHSYAYYSRDEPTLLRLLVVGPWLLVPLGIVGLADRWRTKRRDGFGVLASFAPVYALSVAVFFVSSRYRLPLLLPLCLGAGCAVERLTQALRNRRALLVGYAGGLLPLAILASWPFGLDDGRSEERTALLVRLVEEGRSDEALRHLPGCEAGHRQPGVLCYRLGLALLARGEAGAAAEQFERALAHDPDQGEIRLSLAQALGSLGRREEAKAVLAGIPPGRLGSPEAEAGVGHLALELGDAALAERFLREAARRAPHNAGVHENLGLALVLLEREREAVQALEAACDLNPSNPSARLNLAVTLAKTGRRDAALARLEEALCLRPDYPEALRLRAALRGLASGQSLP